MQPPPLRPKIRIVSGHPNSQPLIAKGGVEMGLYNLSEIHEGTGEARRPGSRALQLTTTFEGALMSDGSVPEAARAFIRFLANADVREKSIAAKLEPLGDH
jgi:hypothetical protein